MLVLLWLPATGEAGAWLREKGGGFLSFSTTGYFTDSGARQQNSVYLEYGLIENLTIGIDGHQNPYGYGHALAFIRLPIYHTPRQGRFSTELSLGAHHDLGRTSRMWKATLSYGYGYESRWGSGWLAIDAALEVRTSDNRRRRKLDITAGMNADRLLNPMLNIETARDRSGRQYWAITPAIIIRGKAGTRWITGIEKRSAYPDAYGLKIAMWRDF